MDNKRYSEIPIVQRKQVKGTNTVIAIVIAKDWFTGGNVNLDIYGNFYVVCKWYDFHDGEKSHIEGMQTLAMCADLNIAGIVYKSIKK